MTRNEKIKFEMTNLRHEISHLGACTTSGKSEQEIAHIDERFFLACEKLESLKAGLQRSKNLEKNNEACL
ncbi:hypothetical protein AS4_17320 [Acinetobacter guillouiae]|uniref:hypothetical protein n=1 Tax=Acinetobacter guillouiae TaxID=106649 RepID=UPI0004EF67D3|nr:hypothetical protein [Acinetobacter guillouiae]BAP36672.1 hypothetical protein AS4_17320 [Acinetobacter guillouiae]